MNLQSETGPVEVVVTNLDKAGISFDRSNVHVSHLNSTDPKLQEPDITIGGGRLRAGTMQGKREPHLDYADPETHH